MGGILPGAADLTAFWQNILSKNDAARDVPAHRWIVAPDDVLGNDLELDRVYSLRACLVDHIPLDAAGLDLDAGLLAQLDPLYHMVLHAGRAAFLDGVTAGLDRARVGVVLAAIALPTDSASAIAREVFARFLEETAVGGISAGRIPENPAGSISPGLASEPTPTHPLNSRVVGLPAALLAKALGLGGGSYTLDAACASSLYALKLACDELREGRADAMLAGGVSRPDCLHTQMGFCQLRALSRSGRCSPFDESSDGLVVGEGAGVFLLKRLDDALRDGDRVYGVIRGIGLSNDIGGSLLAPDSEGQLRAMHQAYEASGWSPQDVDLVECHGTGTPVGDAVEIRSLRELWGGGGWREGQCPIGSVKSNVGHLLTGAGAAGLLKTLLALREKTLPPAANFRKCAAGIPLEGGPFRVQTEPAEWPARGPRVPRRAAVNAFGFGGINAHVLVEEWLPDAADPARCVVATPPKSGCEPASPADHAPIAIVGMEARFGDIASLREFQELVLRGESAIRPRPPDRWYGADEQARAVLGGRALPGAYRSEVTIPIGTFRIPPNEIPEVLPQQLLMLDVAAAALIDAGLSVGEPRPRAGVIVGMALDLTTTDCHLRWWLAGQVRQWAARLGLHLDPTEETEWIAALREATAPPLTAARTMGALGNILASRIAREFRFGGPSFAVSCDEVSGLRALDIAVRALRRRDMDAAVVGAVDLAGDARAVLTSHALRAFSARGESRPFEASADGPTVAEGAAAVVLKRLDDAVRDGDRVYAIVRGLGCATGGGVESAVPDLRAYETAVRRAGEDAAIDLRSVDYIEAHGSGDPREDGLEATALRALTRERESPAALGSVKANIGGAGAAAGLASLVKASLCLYQEMLPPMPGFERPCEQLGTDLEGLHVPRNPVYWARDRITGPRRAGVSAVSMEGNCLHVVLEEHEEPAGRVGDVAEADRREVRSGKTVIERLQPLGARPVAVFVVEGADPAALAGRTEDLARCLTKEQGTIEAAARRWHTVSAQAGTARPRRRNGPDTGETADAQTPDDLAVAFVASDPRELLRMLAESRRRIVTSPQEPLDGKDGVFYEPRPLGLRGQLALVFPGSGSHYAGMGRVIAAQWPEVLRDLDRQTERLGAQMMPRWFVPWRMTWPPGWEREADAAITEDMQRMIFGQVSYGMVASDLLRRVNVRPDAVIGYSLGESVGLFALRAWSSGDEMWRRMSASSLFKTDLADRCDAVRRTWGIPDHEEVDWRVVVLGRPVEQVQKALDGISHARLLIVNTPDECVVGGLRRDVEAVARRLDCRPIRVEGVPTVHCEVVRAVEEAYRDLHLLPTLPPSGVRFYSAVWGHAYEVGRQSAATSITGQALSGFDFPALIRQAYDDGVRLFVEAGPQGSCTRMIGKILAGRAHFARSASSRGEDEMRTFLNLLAALAVQRVPIDWGIFYGGESPAVGHRPSARKAPGRGDITVRTGRRITGLPRPKHVARAQDGPDGRPAIPMAPSGLTLPSIFGGVLQGEAGTVELPPAVPESLIAGLSRMTSAMAEAHRAFLDFSQTAAAQMAELVAAQARLPGGTGDPGAQPTPEEVPLTGQLPLSMALAGPDEHPPAAGTGLHGETHPTPERAAHLTACAPQIQGCKPVPPLGSSERLDMGAAPDRSGEDDVSAGSVPVAQGMAHPGAPGPPESPVLAADQPLVESLADSVETPQPPEGESQPGLPTPSFPRELCLEFAKGSLANVLGPDFATVDSYPVRVRLPAEPLMLVDRIVSVEGVERSLSHGRIVTEHDVLPGAWYLDGDRCPISVTIEAGQADLFLCSYLGIDLAVRGERAYRLLDATVTFQGRLPRPGEVVRYDIRILRFVRQGDTYLFFFEFDGTINGEPILSMREGCAGFFTSDEIEHSGGIILTEEDTRREPGRCSADWRPPVPIAAEAYDDDAVASLRAGNLPGCFGPLFEGLGLRDPLRLPGGRMRLFDRVMELDPAGGRCGLGLIRTEADIHPDDWFLTCHFVDDMTMPGTLMYECCLHTLRFFLLRMGWVGERDTTRCEPIRGIPGVLRCRGPVTPRTKKVEYRVEIKELGYRPEPYAIADALMFADGKRIVQIKDMALQIIGLEREQIETRWRCRTAAGTGEPAPAPAPPAQAPEAEVAVPAPAPVVFSKERILAFCRGNPSDAFGEPYRPYDSQRRIARLPSPPYLCFDRIVAVGSEPWQLKAGNWAEAEYDVPADAWYFRANRQVSMPFCVLLEVGLQSCGWLAAYMGSVLHSKADLSFRNLGGRGIQHEEVFPDAGTLRTHVRLTDVSEAGGMILQNFQIAILRQARKVYEGESTFGFFTQAALAQQVGIRDAKDRRYAPTGLELARARRVSLPAIPPLSPDDPAGAVEHGLALPARAYRMIDEIDVLIPDGGPKGLGYIHGTATVDPEAWFFKAHFYQDPVWPGSLGLESFLQLLKVYALDRWGDRLQKSHRFEPMALELEHKWKYRGQIIPASKRVEVEAVVTRLEDMPAPLVVASGFLKVDGVCIYEMTDLGVRLVEGDSQGRGT